MKVVQILDYQGDLMLLTDNGKVFRRFETVDKEKSTSTKQTCKFVWTSVDLPSSCISLTSSPTGPR